MFDSITYTPNDGGSALGLMTPTYPVGVFTWKYETASEEQPKQDYSGQHDTLAPVRRMTITIGAQIVGDSVTDYWSKRLPVAAALLPPQGAATANFNHGTISFVCTGGGTYSAGVVLTSLDLPLEPGDESAESTTPRSSTFTAEMRCNLGYWSSGGSAARI